MTENHTPRVSILIGAYKPQYFVEAIESALAQRFTDFELIVGDDGPGTEIQEITARYQALDPRISYYRNESNLGSRANFIKLFDRARGELIKFLCDDDRLHPACLTRMVACLDAYPEVTLVTSHRRYIDKHGNEAPELGRAHRPSAEDCRIPGTAVANRVVRWQTNFIGEPTTVMFRRRDLAGIAPDIFSFEGQQFQTNGDVVMWLNLLVKGDALFLVEPMSDFRHHVDQEQLTTSPAREAPKVWAGLMMACRNAGILRPEGNTDLPLIPLGTFRPWWPAEVRRGRPRREAGRERRPARGHAGPGAGGRPGPEEVWIPVMQAGLRLVMQDPVGALDYYQAALALSPEHPRVLTNLASVLLHRRRRRAQDRRAAGPARRPPVPGRSRRHRADDPAAGHRAAQLTGQQPPRVSR